MRAWGVPIRAARGVTGLAHDPRADVGVGANQEIRTDVLKGNAAVAAESRTRMNRGRCPACRLKRFFEREDEPHRSSQLEREPCQERLELRPSFAAKSAARIGRDDADRSDWTLERGGHDPLQHIRMLSGAPHGDAVGVGRREKGMRFDGEVRDHRKAVVVIKHDVGGGAVEMAPAELPAPHRVRARQRIASTQLRILNQQRLRIERVAHRQHRGKLGELDMHQRGRPLGRIDCVGRYHGHGLARKLRLADGDERPIGDDRSVARDRLRQIARGDDGAHAGHLRGGFAIDADDASMRAGKGDELEVEYVVEPDVGCVLLQAGDALDRADSWE